MNAVGEPYEGNLQVRFDEGRGETQVTLGAPRLLYCTLAREIGGMMKTERDGACVPSRYE